MRYGSEWTPGIILLGAVIVFPLVPPFALIAVVLLALAVLAGLVALAAALVAAPFVLAHRLHKHFAEHHQRTKAAAPIGTPIAHPATVTE